MTDYIYQTDDPEPPRCQATVYRRDTYRYTGRRGGFSMHYNRGTCERRARDTGYCWQHQAEAADAARETTRDQ